MTTGKLKLADAAKCAGMTPEELLSAYEAGKISACFGSAADYGRIARSDALAQLDAVRQGALPIEFDRADVERLRETGSATVLHRDESYSTRQHIGDVGVFPR